MFKKIAEGKAEALVSIEKKISKALPVFYNPVMKLNRDTSIAILNSVKNKDMQIALPLSGSGIRGIRLLKELKKGKIKSISFNDSSETAIKLIKKNLKLNNLEKNKNAIVSCNDANLFLLESKGFDYIDIDPFGTPNPFLDSAIKRLSREGIIAVTATDTSSLAGTYPSVCMRKYWAKPMRNELMHETGLRILIRKTQLIASQYEKGLTPIFSYSSDHYMRVFLKCDKGKTKADSALKQHGFLNYKKTGEWELNSIPEKEHAGPLYTGPLWDSAIVKEMIKQKTSPELNKLLETIGEEAKINSPFFYDIHAICKKNKIAAIPKKENVVTALKKKRFSVSNTHFSPLAIKSNAKFKEIIKILKK